MTVSKLISVMFCTIGFLIYSAAFGFIMADLRRSVPNGDLLASMPRFFKAIVGGGILAVFGQIVFSMMQNKLY